MRGTFRQRNNAYKKHTFEISSLLNGFSHMKKIYWHQHGLSVFLVTLGYQPNLSLRICSLGGLGLYRGTVQDPARVYGALGSGPSCKVCWNLAKKATLNLYP